MYGGNLNTGALDPIVFALRYDWRSNSVLFVHNLDSKPREVTFSSAIAADARGKHRLLLEAYAYRWHRVDGLDYLLKRSDIETCLPR